MDNTNNVTLLAAEPYISELTETQSKLTTPQGEEEAQLSKKVILSYSLGFLVLMCFTGKTL